MPCNETGGCASRAPGRRDAAPPKAAAWARLVLFACLAVALLALPSRSFAQTTPEAPPPEGLILLPDAGAGAAATPGGGAPGSEFQDCPECPVMVVLPDGSAIGKYPVTRGEFAAFATATGFEGKGCNQRAGNTWTKVADSDWATPGYPQTDRDPVVCVSWLEANTYGEWLSEKTGKLYRLPTFEELQAAAIGGGAGEFWWGDDAAEVCKYANVADQSFLKAHPDDPRPMAACDDGFPNTAPVGSFAPNGYGLYDVSGNVWQWTNSCPKGDCSHGVFRGGAFSGAVADLKSAHSWGDRVIIRSFALGFRVLRSAQ